MFSLDAIPTREFATAARTAHETNINPNSGLPNAVNLSPNRRLSDSSPTLTHSISEEIDIKVRRVLRALVL